MGVKIESAHFEDGFIERLGRYNDFLQKVKEETQVQEELLDSIVVWEYCFGYLSRILFKF